MKRYSLNLIMVLVFIFCFCFSAWGATYTQEEQQANYDEIMPEDCAIDASYGYYSYTLKYFNYKSYYVIERATPNHVSLSGRVSSPIFHLLKNMYIRLHGKFRDESDKYYDTLAELYGIRTDSIIYNRINLGQTDNYWFDYVHTFNVAWDGVEDVIDDSNGRRSSTLKHPDIKINGVANYYPTAWNTVFHSGAYNTIRSEKFSLDLDYEGLEDKLQSIHLWTQDYDTRTNSSGDDVWDDVVDTPENWWIDLSQYTCTHSNLSAWKSDSEYHYKTCTRCGATVEKAKHTWGTKYVNVSAGSHKRVCSVCNGQSTEVACTNQKEVIVTNPTCTAVGENKWVCKDCGGDTGAISSIPALGHSWSSAWTSDGTNHWHVCTRCNTASTKTAHTWTLTASVDDCTSGAYKDYKCNVCGKTKRDTTRQPGHNYVVTYHDENGVKNAYKQSTCTRCGAVTGSKVYDKTNTYYKITDSKTGAVLWNSYPNGYKVEGNKGAATSLDYVKTQVNKGSALSDTNGLKLQKYSDTLVDIGGKLYKWQSSYSQIYAGTTTPSIATGTVVLQYYNVTYKTIEKETNIELATSTVSKASGSAVKGSDLGTANIIVSGIPYRYVGETTAVVYDKAITVYRYMTKDQYNIHFNSNGGTGTMSSIKAAYGKSVTLPANAFSKVGYTFAYWSRNTNGSDGSYNDKDTVLDIVKTGSNDVTLYAIWQPNKYTVSFKNLYNSTKEDITVTYDSQYGSGVATKLPTRAGYTFDYWVLNGKKIDSTTIVTTASNHTLAAVWKEKLCKVTFVDNGSATNVTVIYSGCVSQPYTPYKAGMTFKWWSEEPDGTAFDFSTSITKDMNLYAVFEGNVINIELPGYGTIKRTYPEEIGVLPEPQRPGYRLDGWYYDTAYNNPVGSKDIVPTSGPVTLYPKYTQVTYEMKFDTGDGSLSIHYGDTVPELPTPEKDNMIFKGWYKDDTLISAGDIYEYDGNVTLKAKWEYIMCTVSFSDGTVKEVIRGDSVGALPTVPAKDGKVSVGWVNQEGKPITEATIVTSNLVCTPKYENKKITVTFVDGSNTWEERYEGGVVLVNLPIPSRDGYKFRWWSLTTTGPAYNGKPISDITLYSIYTSGINYIMFDCLTTRLERGTGELFGNLPEPSKDGYNFDCWLHPNGSKVKSTDTVPSGGERLTAKWIAKTSDLTDTVEIRFWSDGIRINTIDLLRGEILYDQADPALSEVDSRKFLYWSLTPNGDKYEFGHYVNTELDLYAVWQ